MITPEQKRKLKGRGYRVGTYESVLPDDQPDQPGGGSYDSFPAVFAPNGQAVEPYDLDGSPADLDSQWAAAWSHYRY